MTDPSLAADAREVADRLGERNAAFAGATVILTGAAGFLGTQFCHYFRELHAAGRLAKPCRVLAFDSFARGRPAWVDDFREGPIEFVTADVVQFRDYPAADFVIHAASIASPTFYRKHPIATMDANVLGLRTLLDHAVATRPRSFLVFSTSEIYGDPDAANIPTPETYRGFVSCTGPRACYDESKRYGETLAVNFHAEHGVPVKTVRPFNNYGPGLKITDRRVIPDFARNLLAGEEITILSDGRATRTFCYITDAIVGYLLALLSPHDGEAFNIGADSPEITVRELAEAMIRASGKQAVVRFAADQDPHYNTDNPQRRCPDLSKARRLLGFEPRVGLDEGLTRTMRYYEANPTGSES